MKRIIPAIFALMFLLCACREKTPQRAVLPILMYHHVAEIGDDLATVSVDSFEKHMSELHVRGFTPVSFGDVINFVYSGEPLPEKPVLIVFDDGYLSNYELALPILSEYGFKAGISVIGSSVGVVEGQGIIPHFSWEQARAMKETGLVELASHTYDMHGVVPKGSAGLTADHELMRKLFAAELGEEVRVFAYPHGIWNCDSENTLRSIGVQMTLISDGGVNVIYRGERDCLYLLRRFNVCETVDFTDLLNNIERYY